jgi:hypothetical protein
MRGGAMTSRAGWTAFGLTVCGNVVALLGFFVILFNGALVPLVFGIPLLGSLVAGFALLVPSSTRRLGMGIAGGAVVSGVMEGLLVVAAFVVYFFVLGNEVS